MKYEAEYDEREAGIYIQQSGEVYNSGRFTSEVSDLPTRRAMFAAKLNDLVIRKEIKANNIAVRCAENGLLFGGANGAKGKVKKLRNSYAPIIEDLRTKVADLDTEIIQGKI